MFLKLINRLLYLLIITLVIYSCNSTKSQIKLTYKDFKTGTFKAVNKGIAYTIKRKNNYQLERIDGIEGEIKYKINWIGNYKYVLIYDSNTLSNKKLSDKYSNVKDPITIELIEIKGNYCYFKSIFRGKVSYDKMEKIN